MNAATKPEAMQEVRLCCGCHHPLVRKTRPNGAHERLCEFKKRKHCNAQCAGVSQALSIQKPPCEYCGSPLVRKIYATGAVEPSNSFRHRKYCNRTCSRRGALKSEGYDVESMTTAARVFPRKFESCKPPVLEKRPVIAPPVSAPGQHKTPTDYTKKTEQGYFKETTRGIFRWDGYEWVRSTKSKTVEPPKPKKT